MSSSCLVSAIPVYTSGICRTDVSKFFEPSVKCIVNAVVEQRELAHKSISVSFPLLATPLDLSLTQVYVLARRARRWFRSQQLAIHQSSRITQTPWTQRSAARKPRVRPLPLSLPLSIQAHFFRFSLSLLRSKAVSDGAISFYLDHFVRTRVSAVTYGTFCSKPYNSSDPKHVRRQDNTFTNPSGTKMINDMFDIILPKVCGLVVCMSRDKGYSSYL